MLARVLPVVAGLGLLCISSPAAAHPPPCPECEYEKLPEPEPASPARLEVGVGFPVGSYGVGGIGDKTFGFAIHAGRRWGRTLVAAEYDLLSTGGDDLAEGRMHRLGADLRVDLLDFGRRLKDQLWFGGVIWGEAGVGWEAIGWRTGDQTRRGDVSLGVGAQYTIRMGGERPRTLGLYYEARVLVAESPASRAVAALCVDGCAPAGSARDLGVFFVGGMTFSR